MEIKLTRHNYTTKEDEDAGTVNTYTLSRCMDEEAMARLLDDWVNCYTSKGVALGRAMRRSHLTIQRTLVKMLLEVIVGLSEQEYTDGRNETAIATAQKIKAMYEAGELPMGMMR